MMQGTKLLGNRGNGQGEKKCQQFTESKSANAPPAGGGTERADSSSAPTSRSTLKSATQVRLAWRSPTAPPPPPPSAPSGQGGRRFESI